MTALTCLADSRLRLACSLILRHMGFRVIESETLMEARALFETQPFTLVVGGALADPDNQLAALAHARQIRHVRVGPDMPLESLLNLLDNAAMFPPEVTGFSSPTRRSTSERPVLGGAD